MQYNCYIAVLRFNIVHIHLLDYQEDFLKDERAFSRLLKHYFCLHAFRRSFRIVTRVEFHIGEFYLFRDRCNDFRDTRRLIDGQLMVVAGTHYDRCIIVFATILFQTCCRLFQQHSSDTFHKFAILIRLGISNPRLIWPLNYFTKVMNVF